MTPWTRARKLERKLAAIQQVIFIARTYGTKKAYEIALDETLEIVVMEVDRIA